jgi:hypothetical protein
MLGADPSRPGADPFDKTVIETPMDTVAYEATTIRRAPFSSIENCQSKNEIQTMYQLLRRSGVHPTVTQADEVKTMVAVERLPNREEGSNTSERIADARALANHNHYSEGFDSTETGDILRLDIGI